MSTEQRSIVVTESNLSQIAEAIRDGRMVYHGSKLAEQAGCAVQRAIDESSPAMIAESLALVFFDPCCAYLAIIVSELFARVFGERRRPDTLSRRDWDSYISQRRRGAIAPVGGELGRPVRDRVVEQDCNLLLAILNWAAQAGDGRGGYLLNRNPSRA